MTFKRLSALSISSAALLFSACGGGGGSNGNIPIIGGGSGSSGSLTFTPGSFSPSSGFKSRCEFPRSGSNDISGSYLHEKFWLRSWSNETYLWYNEITDIDPANADYPLPVDYFETLKTNATTASGAPRDRFHFTISTEEYDELVNGASAGYGARFRLLDTTAPDRQAVIAYVEPGTPAAQAGLMRGTEILEIDGEPLADGSAAILNAGLSPENPGESHTFLVRDFGETETRTVTLVADTIESRPVFTTNVQSTTNGENVAYVALNTFGTRPAEEALFNTFNSLRNQSIDHLVLDLRYNGGGFLDISAELGYMIAGNNTTGRTYSNIVFNDKHPRTNPVTGETLSPTPFHSTGQDFTVSPGTPLPTLNLDTVYILSTASTCSASESLINALDGINVNVVLVGSTTCGKPYGFYATDNCGTTYFTIQFRGENDVGFGDYADGFSPFEGATTLGEPIDGCALADDFGNALGDDDEALFGAALTHIESGACPAPAATSAKPNDLDRFKVAGDYGYDDLMADPRVQKRRFLENNIILNRSQ